MTALLLVLIVVVLLTLVLVCLKAMDAVSDRNEATENAQEYYYAPIDELPLAEAKEAALTILEQLGQKRPSKSHGLIGLNVHRDIAAVISQYQLTFDSLTNQLDVVGTAPEGSGDYLQIGTWLAGEGIFVSSQSSSAKIYIDAGDAEYCEFAPTIYHYVLKAKQESDWADEIRDKG